MNRLAPVLTDWRNGPAREELRTILWPIYNDFTKSQGGRGGTGRRTSLRGWR